MITIRPLRLSGVFEILPKKQSDARGFFSETWSRCALAEAGIDLEFVQDNHSLSTLPGTLRGLHFQTPPHAQDKLVRVIRGAIFDVVVDIRNLSPSFGRWDGIKVSREKWNQVLVPKGFAHGFVTLEADTEVVYKVTSDYSPQHDRAIRFDDPTIGIEWPQRLAPFHLSAKDRDAPRLGDIDTGFGYP